MGGSSVARAAAKANKMCIKIKNDKSWQIKITHTHTHARTHPHTHTHLRCSPNHLHTKWRRRRRVPKLNSNPNRQRRRRRPNNNNIVSNNNKLRIVIFLGSFPLPFSLRSFFLLPLLVLESRTLLLHSGPHLHVT